MFHREKPIQTKSSVPIEDWHLVYPMAGNFAITQDVLDMPNPYLGDPEPEITDESDPSQRLLLNTYLFVHDLFSQRNESKIQFLYQWALDCIASRRKEFSERGEDTDSNNKFETNGYVYPALDENAPVLDFEDFKIYLSFAELFIVTQCGINLASLDILRNVCGRMLVHPPHFIAIDQKGMRYKENYTGVRENKYKLPKKLKLVRKNLTQMNESTLFMFLRNDAPFFLSSPYSPLQKSFCTFLNNSDSIQPDYLSPKANGLFNDLRSAGIVVMEEKAPNNFNGITFTSQEESHNLILSHFLTAMNKRFYSPSTITEMYSGELYMRCACLYSAILPSLAQTCHFGMNSILSEREKFTKDEMLAAVEMALVATIPNTFERQRFIAYEILNFTTEERKKCDCTELKKEVLYVGCADSLFSPSLTQFFRTMQKVNGDADRLQLLREPSANPQNGIKNIAASTAGFSRERPLMDDATLLEARVSELGECFSIDFTQEQRENTISRLHIMYLYFLPLIHTIQVDQKEDTLAYIRDKKRKKYLRNTHQEPEADTEVSDSDLIQMQSDTIARLEKNLEELKKENDSLKANISSLESKLLQKKTKSHAVSQADLTKISHKHNQEMKKIRSEVVSYEREREQMAAQLAQMEHQLMLSTEAQQPTKPWLETELPETGILFCGGHENMVNKLSALYPKWNYISSFNENSHLPVKPKAIMLWAKHISHKVYYRISSEYSRSIICYVDSTNIDMLLDEIRYELWNLERKTE